MSQAGLDEPEFWRRVRGEFFLDKDWIYLNNGTLGPAPKPVYYTLIEKYHDLAQDPGQPNADQRAPPTRCVARPPPSWARTSTRSRSCGTPPKA
jgi:hypothetical protein